ncbi:MAG: InlB B-repeat-containing protein [Peptococcaceae bacterium]|nr:InlB B-repeat-containing protein [Peptococcaceae bacterium]
MKNKKFFAIVTLVCFLFTLMPVAAFATGEDTMPTVYIAGEVYTQSSTTSPSGVSIDWDSKTITLNGANIEWDLSDGINSDTTGKISNQEAAAIRIADMTNSWTINASGENNIKLNLGTTKNATGYGIYSETGLTISGSSTSDKLTVSATSTRDAQPIMVQGNLNITGVTLNAKAENAQQSTYLICAGDFMSGEGDIKVSNASVKLESNLYGEFAIMAMGGITIENGAEVEVEADNINAGLCTFGEEITISGEETTVDIDCLSIALSSDTTISGGTVKLKVTDTDEMATKTAVCANIEITGGNITIESTGIGIGGADKVEVTGGTVTVEAPVAVSVEDESANVNISTGTYNGDIEAEKDATVTIYGNDTVITGDITMAGVSDKEDAASSLTISGGATVSGIVSTSEGAMVKTTDSEGKTVYTSYKDVESAKDAVKNVEEGTTVESITIPNENEDGETEEPMAPLTYTVTFNTNGGTDVASQTIGYYQKATEPTAPTKDGFTFAGWFTSEDDGATLSETAYDFATPVEEDITLYAKWEEKQTPAYTGGYYTPSTSTDAEVISPNEDVKLTAKAISTSTLNDAKDAVAEDENAAVIGGKDSAVQIAAKEDGKVLDSFVQPVTVTVPVSKSALNDVEDVNNLTLALVTEDENGNTALTYVGGNYDAQEGTFTAYTNQPGNYVLVEKSDIVKIDMFIGNTTSMINGEAVANDVAAYIANDRTMVPAAFIMDQLGCKVDWFGDERKVVITLPDGSQLSMIIDQEIPGFGAVPVIKDDRTMVPIAYIADAMGAHVLWVGDEYRVVIVK